MFSTECQKDLIYSSKLILQVDMTVNTFVKEYSES